MTVRRKESAALISSRLPFTVTRRGGSLDNAIVKWRVVVVVEFRLHGRRRRRGAGRKMGKEGCRRTHEEFSGRQRALCSGCLAAAGGCNPGLFIRRKRRAKETPREWRNAKHADGAFTVLRLVRAITSRAASLVTSRACFSRTRKGGWKRWFRPNENCRKGGVGFGFVLRMDTWICTIVENMCMRTRVSSNFSIPSLHTLNLLIHACKCLPRVY